MADVQDDGIAAHLETAWRPFEPGIGKRFFIADDHGDYWWIGCARDREHFIELLRRQGAEWEVDVEGRYAADQGIDVMLMIGLVEVRELTAAEVARRRRCHTEDESRGVIPLSEAALGDLFCSEW